MEGVDVEQNGSATIADTENATTDYNFDCPQFTDFGNEDVQSLPEFENQDGYFAMRRSSIGMEKVPAQWLQQMETGTKNNKTADVGKDVTITKDVDQIENRDSNASELPNPPTKPTLANRTNVPKNMVIDTRTTKTTSSTATDKSKKPASPRYALATKSYNSKRRSSVGKRDRSNSPRISRTKRTKSLTEPQAPNFATNARARKIPQLSSTTLELQKVALEKQKMEAARQMEKHKLENMNRGGAPIPRVPLTQPKTPNLKVSHRPGVARAQEAKKEASKKAPVQRPTATGPGPVRITRPEPFNLRTSKVVKNQESAKTEEFESVAKKVNQFHNKTPARFRTKRNSSPLPKSSPLHLTEPASVKLATKTRSRASFVPSQTQKEDEFMNNIKPFKARPFQQKIMHSAGDLGVPKVEKKQPCKPQEFSFQTEQRANKRAASPVKRGRSPSFGARSTVSKSSLGHHPTKPRSSTPEPFRLRSQQRHEEAQRQLERRLQKEREEEEKKRSFKARPLPVHNYGQAMHARPAEQPLTEPVTPRALTRSKEAAERRRIQLAREEEERKRQMNFKALGLPQSTYEKSFEPQYSDRVVVPDNVILQSDVRAQKREKFEETVKEKQLLREQEQQFLAEQKRIEEEKELKEYRKSLVHKALPLPYKSSRIE